MFEMTNMYSQAEVQFFWYCTKHGLMVPLLLLQGKSQHFEIEGIKCIQFHSRTTKVFVVRISKYIIHSCCLYSTCYMCTPSV